MNKKIFTILLTLIFTLSLTISSFATSNVKTDGHYSWFPTKKTLVDSTSYGSWKTVREIIVRKKEAPQNISWTGKKYFKNHRGGSLKISAKKLDLYVGYDTTKSISDTVEIEKDNASAGTWLGQTRGVFYKHKVKQEKFYVIDGKKHKTNTNPVYVYTYKYRYPSSRFIKK